MTKVEITFVVVANDWKLAAELAERACAAVPQDELAIFREHGSRFEIDMETR
jgi:hypothetical protein